MGIDGRIRVFCNASYNGGLEQPVANWAKREVYPSAVVRKKV